MINLLKLDNEMGLVMLELQHETHDCKYLFKTYTYSRGFLLLQVASLNMYYIKSNTIACTVIAKSSKLNKTYNECSN